MKNGKFGSILFILPFALLFVSASVQTAEKPIPTTCKKCDMKISTSERKFSAYVMKGIEPSAFNDLGCAVLWRDGECAMRQEAFDDNGYVYDYKTASPVPAASAFYVTGAGIKTPRGYGILAFKDKGQAETFIAEQEKGEVLSFDEFIMLELKEKQASRVSSSR